MPRYLITYDLHDGESDRDALSEHLKTIGARQLTASSYILKSNEGAAADIKDGILAITERISLVVFRISSKKDHALHNLTSPSPALP